MNKLNNLLARVMLTGTLIAAVIIAAGLSWYLVTHLGQATGDHLFSGEPLYFRDPVDMVARAMDFHDEGHRRSLLMIGLVLLLLNPPIRVALAAIGYGTMKDRLYTIVSSIVFLVLVISFFW